jgi:hypothetical protein
VQGILMVTLSDLLIIMKKSGSVTQNPKCYCDEQNGMYGIKIRWIAFYFD